jgi:hypothetical protein
VSIESAAELTPESNPTPIRVVAKMRRAYSRTAVANLNPDFTGQSTAECCTAPRWLALLSVSFIAPLLDAVRSAMARRLREYFKLYVLGSLGSEFEDIRRTLEELWFSRHQAFRKSPTGRRLLNSRQPFQRGAHAAGLVIALPIALTLP